MEHVTPKPRTRISPTLGEEEKNRPKKEPETLPTVACDEADGGDHAHSASAVLGFSHLL